MSKNAETKLRSIDAFRVAPPFDRSLASLYVRHTSNEMPENGYDVTLSASLTPQTILLQAGAEEIEVLCEIVEAEVRLTSANSDLLPGSDYLEISQSKKSQWTKPATVETSDTHSTSRNIGLDTAGPSGRISAGSVSNVKHAATAAQELGFYHSTLETLRLKFADGRVLDGPIVDGYAGWVVQPVDKAKPSGVRLDLVVREPWLRFSKVETHSNGTLGASVRRLLYSNEFKGTEKRALFEDLLKRLAIHGLSTKNEREATLDQVARILLPGDGSPSEHQLDIGGPGSIPINSELLGKFLDAEEADARAVFLAISKALETPKKTGASSSRKSSRSFAPQGTVFSALEALEKLNSAHQSEEYEIEALKSEIGENTYNDLSVMGFFEGNRKLGKIRFRKFGGTADVAVFRALLAGNWFEYAESVVQGNVRIGTTELGAAVSDHFGLNWSLGSKKRNGQNIRKWVINLSPSLLPPDEDHPDYFYINSFKRRAPAKGATPIITLDMAKVFEEEKLVKGVPYKDTAKRFGVSAGSYLNFRKREPEIAAEAEQLARSENPDLFGED
ncbi:MAG: hypothetical protein QNJ20_02220 [Paracoccaceae bacterium]|nr:hypothetical protein [Paracoccaceae bacterium]